MHEGIVDSIACEPGSITEMLARGGGWLVGRELPIDGGRLRILGTRAFYAVPAWRNEPSLVYRVGYEESRDGGTTTLRYDVPVALELAGGLGSSPAAPAPTDAFAACLANCSAYWDLAAADCWNDDLPSMVDELRVQFTELLITTTIAPFAAGSFGAWCSRWVPAMLRGLEGVVCAGDRWLRYRVDAVSFVADAWNPHGTLRGRVCVHTKHTREWHDVDLYLDGLTAGDRAAARFDETHRARVEGCIDAYHQWLRAELAQTLAGWREDSFDHWHPDHTLLSSAGAYPMLASLRSGDSRSVGVTECSGPGLVGLPRCAPSRQGPGAVYGALDGGCWRSDTHCCTSECGPRDVAR